jgi:NADP-dependent aldehyde dehydrogenase
MKLSGTSIIGYERGAATGATLQGVNAATGELLEPVFHGASLEETDAACRLAAEAFRVYGRADASTRAKFLRRAAGNLEDLGPALIERAAAETGLPAARLEGERGRTCFQLRLFADLAEEGSWVDARIDRADPARQPLPKPDLRSMLRPLGPAAVFGASNFPLAYSAAGGDTASALAAGCPVVAVAHYAHPGTAELAGACIRDAAEACGLPAGVFSLLFAAGNEVGQAVVQHPAIKAVGFTGSRRGGLALMRLAQSRPEPIPFYGEMSSVNPVFVLPGALRERGAEIAAGLAASVTFGVGQFCTNPGLTILPQDADGQQFAATLNDALAAAPVAAMLNAGIGAAYAEGVAARAATANVATLRAASQPGEPALFQTTAADFAANPALADEIFGPATTIVTHDNRDEVLAFARGLEGQLTATVHATDEDLRDWAELLAILETRAGRLVFNGYPTGVEVCDAMVHGGPFPATSDGRATSVGPRAIRRWARLVCWQNCPPAALPAELRDDNPLRLRRIADGAPER